MDGMKKTEMTFYEQMAPALSALLNDGERLQAPVYGSMRRRRDYVFGYFGLTDDALLIALLEGSSKRLCGGRRILLHDIHGVNVKKSLLPLLYKIRLELADGSVIQLRLSRKVLGFDTQQEHLNRFLSKIQK